MQRNVCFGGANFFHDDFHCCLGCGVWAEFGKHGSGRENGGPRAFMGGKSRFPGYLSPLKLGLGSSLVGRVGTHHRFLFKPSKSSVAIVIRTTYT